MDSDSNWYSDSDIGRVSVTSFDRFVSLMGWSDITSAERLIKNGADVNARDKRNRTALMMCESPAFAELLIKNGADVNACDASGRTALIMCASATIAEKPLIKYRADVNACDASGGTALMMCKSTIIAELLIKNGADVNACDASGRTALMMCKSPAIAELLIKNGADVNACDASGRTALIMCASTTIAELLIKNGADVNACDASGRTALIMCASTTIAEEPLIKNRADVNACDASGGTALMMCKSTIIAELLIKNGADVDACDSSGRTALMMCESTSTAELLIKHGADVNACDASGRTPLMTCKSPAFAVLMIKNGAEVNACDASGRTALMLCESVLFAELLIKNGADVNHTRHDENNRQLSVLSEMLSRSRYVSQFLLRHGAQVSANDLVCLMSNSHFSFFDKLSQQLLDQVLSSGANVNARNGDGFTPLMLCKHIFYAKKLLENGADVNATCIINSKEMSALSLAIKNGCIGVIDVLSTHGAVAQPEDLFKAMKLSCDDKTLAFLITSCPRKKEFTKMRDADGKTPLMLCRTLDSARMLLELGADVNARISDKTNNITVLMDRVRARNVDPSIMLALLKAGADVNATCIINSKKMSALSLAIKNRYMDVRDVLSTHGAVAQPEDLLIALQCDYCSDKTLALLISSCPRKKEFINMRDEYGRTPLMLCRTVESVRMLLELGADVNARISDASTNNFTVLMDRVIRYRLDESIVRALLEAGADVNAVSRTDSTAMSLLMESLSSCRDLSDEWSGCAMLLFKHGAKITKNCELALALMIDTSNLGCIEVLVTNGAAPRILFPSRYVLYSHLIKRFQLHSILSPCCMALLYENVKLARYFREINFLILSDVSLMPKTLKTIVLDEEVHLYIDDMLHHPLSLFRLSFIAVSTLVGPSPGREERVQGLGIPPSLQRKLLFQDLSVKLTE